MASFSSIALQLVSTKNDKLLAPPNLKQSNLPVNVRISLLSLKNEHFKLVFGVGHVDHARVLVPLTHRGLLVQALIGVKDLLTFETHIVWAVLLLFVI